MESVHLISLKGAIEAILFVSEKPVTLEQIQETLTEELKQKPELRGDGWQDFNAEHFRQALELLKKEHEERQSAMTIVEIAGGFQLLTHPRYAAVLRTFYKTRHKEKLSKPALETLAIIAYKQPTTRMDIELVRGVNSDGVVSHLLEKGLIKIAGRREVPGRPFVYGTTKEFLEYFGLKSLDDLPQLEEFPRLKTETPGEFQEALGAEQPALATPSTEFVSETIKEEISTFLQEARLVEQDVPIQALGFAARRARQAGASRRSMGKEVSPPPEEITERMASPVSVQSTVETPRPQALSLEKEEEPSDENREAAPKD